MVFQFGDERVIENFVWQVQVELPRHISWTSADIFSTGLEIAVDGTNDFVIAIGSLVNNRVEIICEGFNEMFLGTRCRCFYRQGPEPVQSHGHKKALIPE